MKGEAEKRLRGGHPGFVAAAKLPCTTACDRQAAPEPHFNDRGAAAVKREAGGEGWEAGLVGGSGGH